jgi:hypothetical protein
VIAPRGDGGSGIDLRTARSADSSQ